MECIFQEEKQVGTWDGRNITASVAAWYDGTVRVLVVDCDFPLATLSLFNMEWVPGPVRHLKTVTLKAEAVRETLRLADEWYASVSATIPAPTEREAHNPPLCAPAGP